MVITPHKMVGLERMSVYGSVGLQRLHYTCLVQSKLVGVSLQKQTEYVYMYYWKYVLAGRYYLQYSTLGRE